MKTFGWTYEYVDNMPLAVLLDIYILNDKISNPEDYGGLTPGEYFFHP